MHPYGEGVALAVAQCAAARGCRSAALSRRELFPGD